MVKVAQGTDGNKEFKAKLAVTTSGCGKVKAIPGVPSNFVKKSDLEQTKHAMSAIEFRLDSPTGKLISTVMQEAQSADLMAPVKGKHDLFLVFPNENIKELDWYRFE